MISLKKNRKRTKIVKFRLHFEEILPTRLCYPWCYPACALLGKSAAAKDYKGISFYRKHIELGFIWFPQIQQLTSMRSFVLPKNTLHCTVFGWNYDFLFDGYFLQTTWEAQTPQMWTLGYRWIHSATIFSFDSQHLSHTQVQQRVDTFTHSATKIAR